MTRKTFTAGALAALAVAALAFAAGCGGDAFDHPGTLAEAKADAARRGVPILLDFSTTW